MSTELVLPEADFAAVAGEAAGHPVEPGAWQVREVAYESGSPATAGLFRVIGQDWSVFVKVLAHLRHWPRLELIPEQFRDEFVAMFPWREELNAWEEPFAGCLPEGMRLPRLHRVFDAGDDRLQIWMEDVDALEGAWEVARFARAAYLLGGFAAMRSAPNILATSTMPMGFAMHKYYEGRVCAGALPLLDIDDIWAHPLLAGAVDPALRDDMRRLTDSLPEVMRRLDSLPQSMPHGDASPQNLLVPADKPDELVAIDISFQTPLAIGFDLGQLLVGLVHAGQMPAADLPAVHEVLVPSFTAGMKDHGVDASEEDVTLGYIGNLLVRAGFF